MAREGRRFRGALIDARVAVRRDGLSRVGFVVPKFGQSAVRRNRLKRVLRDLTRVRFLGSLREAGPGLGMDIVMRVLPRAYRASGEEIRAAFDELRQRLLRFLEAQSGATEITGPIRGRPE